MLCCATFSGLIQFSMQIQCLILKRLRKKFSLPLSHIKLNSNFPSIMCRSKRIKVCMKGETDEERNHAVPVGFVLEATSFPKSM